MLDSVTSARSVTMAGVGSVSCDQALIVDNVDNIRVVRTTLLTVVFKMPRNAESYCQICLVYKLMP